MKKISLLVLMVLSLLLVSYAEEKQTAEDLVQSKRQENINYKQLMEILGKGSSLIHDGIIRENQALVAVGTDMIMFHGAPNHKPWEIFAKKDQGAFKKALIAYDPILHQHAEAIISYAEERNWLKASQSAADLSQSCIACHMSWKSKVIHHMK